MVPFPSPCVDAGVVVIFEVIEQMDSSVMIPIASGFLVT